MKGRYSIPNHPIISGLRFRGIQAPADYANMREIIAASAKVDGFDYSETVEGIAKYYSHLANCDPSRDVLFAEVDGRPIGYSRVWFTERAEGAGYLYHFLANLVPEWRGKGIWEAMLEWCEAKVVNMSASHPSGKKKEIYIWVMETEKDWISILEKAGYRKVRYGFTMLRPDLENIPDIPLPEGIEVRPVKPEHYRKIWDADVKASQDAWLHLKAEEEWYQNWMSSRLFQPDLWQVAWDGDRVAGAVQNHIDLEENAKFNRKRGWTENIHVGREWRGKGLAQALIARSFGVLKEQGMEEAALGVDALNPTGALHLYKKMGFREDKKSFTYSKPVSDIVVSAPSRRG
jgi:mycothiol synthase